MNKKKLIKVLVGTGQVLIVVAHAIARTMVRRLPPLK
jgi:hypothetical protein